MAVALAILPSGQFFIQTSIHRRAVVVSDSSGQFRTMGGEFTEAGRIFGRITNVDVGFLVNEAVRPVVVNTNRRAGYMTRFLSLSIHDLVVMVGMGCFTGSVANVCWDALASSPAPREIAIAAACAGFVAGKFIRDRSGRGQHA